MSLMDWEYSIHRPAVTSSSPLSRAILAGCAYVNLVYIGLWQVLFQYNSVDAFFLRISRRDFLAIALNILLAGSALGFGATALARREFRGRALLGDVLCLTLLLPLANVLRQALRLTPDDAGRWIGALPRGLLPGVFAAGLVGLVLVCGFRPGWLARSCGRLLLLASPFVALTLGRALWIVGTTNLAQFRDRPEVTPPAAPPAPGAQPRVVIVVFDELDYRLTFGVDRPSRPLPAFERLRQESLSADSARAPAENTNESMPGMLTGIPVQALIPRGVRAGALRFCGADVDTDLDSLTTLFERAQAAGFRSGLAGWNVPFCRTGLGAGLAQCRWWPSGIHLGVEEPLIPTMLHQWLSVSPMNSRAIHQVRHWQMQAEAQRMVADSTLGLVVLHLAVPHYPWIFDDETERFTWRSFGPAGYRGNVRLADADLGAIRRELETSGLRPRTTLIVTSDHAWRTASSLDGGSDPRVPFLLHFPGDTRSNVLAVPIQTVHTGDLALAILRGEVGSASDAVAWFRRRGE